MTLRTGHLFAGAGGGILSDLILGHKPIFAVELDEYACQILRERVDDGWFEGMHVHECDVRLFDPSEYAGQVDIIAAGFPCQDISVAGKQSGLGEGTRSGLYREILRIAGIVRPKYLFLENVAAIISQADKIYIAFFERIIQSNLFGAQNNESHTGRYIRRIIEIKLQAAIGRVLGDLATMGYDCRWCCLQASDVGAPHHRDRWWCLATMADAASQQNNMQRRPGEQGRHGLGRGKQAAQQDNRQAGNNSTGGCGENVGHPQHNGQPTEPQLRSDEASSNKRWQEEPQQADRPLDVPSLRRCEAGGEQRRGEDVPNPNPNPIQRLEQEPQPSGHGRPAGLQDRAGGEPTAGSGEAQ